MYGLFGKFKAAPQQREALAQILLKSVGDMAGCLSYVVAEDTTDPDGLWISEVWVDAQSHKASLALPAVQAAIKEAKPLIAGFGERYETRPLGGVGLR